MRVLVTGATGFVGSSLVPVLQQQGWEVLPYSFTTMLEDGVAEIPPNIDAVVHLAARVHVMEERAASPIEAFRKANVEGTLALARRAAEAGIRRFVFVSSIKVMGEQTLPGRPFVETDDPHPVDPYGMTKLEAEEGLRTMCAANGMELVIVRPPLVYGPGVRANFEALIRLVHRGIPLPLASVQNARSMIDVRNLSDLIRECCINPVAPGHAFLVSDGADLSTPELIRYIAQGLGCTARLLPMPSALLAFGAALIGKRAYFERVCGSLQVDSTHIQRTLSWSPPYAVGESVARAAQAWLLKQ